MLYYQKQAARQFQNLLTKSENQIIRDYFQQLQIKHNWQHTALFKDFIQNVRKSADRKNVADLTELIRLARLVIESGTIQGQHRCTVCGQLITADEEIELENGDYICNYCTQSGLIAFCDICQKHCFSENTTRYNGDTYCESCMDEYLVVCHSCGDIVERDEAFYAEDTEEYYCESCKNDGEIAYCHHCNTWNAHNHSSDCITVCDDCYYSYYTTCTDCGEIIHSDYTYYYDDDPYCESCYDNLDIEEDENGNYQPSGFTEQFGGIRDYHATMNLNFFKTAAEKNQSKTLFLGFELEAGKLATSTEAQEVAEHIKGMCNADLCHIDCQRDGSIDSFGFETISHPMTLQYHQEYKWKEIFDYMTSQGMKSHYTSHCGLHIHASRNYLSLSKWSEVDYFLHKFKSQFETLARRSDNEYAEFDCNITAEDTELAKLKKSGKSGNRYRALNLTNRRTVEFRLFRGTLKHETLLATLELVHAVIMFIKSINAIHILKMQDFSAFTRFIRNNKKQYKNLINYLTKKGF